MKLVNFAGKELAGNIGYIQKQGTELRLSINYPQVLAPLVKLYVSLFGIPDIGFQVRFDIFDSSLNKIKGVNYLFDAGCGNGMLTRFAAKICPHARIYAVDISSDLIKLNKKITREENVTFVVRDITQRDTRFKEKIDAVWCFDVLEHIPNYQKALDNFNYMLKKGGYLLIHVPLPNQRRWFKFFANWEHETHTHEGLQEKELLDLLKNYQIIRKQGTFGAIGSLCWEINILLFKFVPPLGALMFPLIRILATLDRIIPSQKYNCLAIFAQKKS